MFFFDTDFTDCHRLILKNNSFPFQGIASKIHEQPDAQLGSREIIQYLFHMGSNEFINRLGFKDNHIPNHEISIIRMRQCHPFVFDLVPFLSLELNFFPVQFHHQCILVNHLTMTSSQSIVDVHATSN